MKVLDGGPVGSALLHFTPRVQLETNRDHMEQISFYLIPSVSHPITLGLVAMQNPHFLWSKNHIITWVPSCGKQCLPNRTVHLQSTTIESPEAEGDLTIPQEYHDLAEVFGPVKATRPSMSPALAGMFFIKKKDGGLMPNADYQRLNEILVKYPYPHPLVPVALVQCLQPHQDQGRG
ncbi:hypothetical protein P4O66_000415 [Electrophorus voltai]|uniref:Uncharacterized protein n=1 Tax=Electrophorus voltai TaxID=2609070 RepID=A0AAD9E068_9TELE|nr:hypothetical protein P4O66_000415 [Electrophorus voltai]